MKRLFLIFGESVDSDLTSWGLLVLRVMIGSMLAFGHGWGKLVRFGEIAPEFYDPFGFGGWFSLSLVIFAEFFCALALILGVATRLAAVPLIIVMLTAVLVIHFDDPWRKMEFAMLYLAPLLTLFISGAGRISFDCVISRASRPRRNIGNGVTH
ncbi:MAG: DoxX family protein [Candidatus Zixiibacteriota bacterium]